MTDIFIICGIKNVKVLKNALGFIMGHLLAMKTYFTLFWSMHCLQGTNVWVQSVCVINFEINRVQH